MSRILFSTLKRFLWVLLLAVFVALTFGRIVHLNFGTDDYAGFVVLQGVFPCEYPYWADYLRMLPLYEWFGLSQAPYYAVTLFLFFLSALSVELFAQILMGNKRIAILSAFFYVSSYVGAVSMHTIFESIRHAQYVSLFLLTLSFYILFLRSHHTRGLWLATVGLFTVTTFLFPYRAYPLIFLLFFLEIFIGRNRRVMNLLKRLIPFVVIDGVIYAGAAFVCSRFPLMQSAGSTALTVVSRFAVVAFGTARVFLTSKIIDLVANLFSLLIPNSILPLIPSPIYVLVLAISIVVLIRWKNKKMKNPILFLVFSTVIVVFGYAVVNTDYVGTSHRYLFTVRPFVAIFMAYILMSSLISFKRTRSITSLIVSSITSILIVMHAIALVSYQNRELYYRGEFSKQAMEAIQKHVPAKPRYTVIFIDGETDLLLDRFWGMFQNIGTPGWAFVPYYGNDPTYYDVVTPNHCSLFWQLYEKRRGTFDLYYFIATQTGVRPASPKNAYLRCKRS